MKTKFLSFVLLFTLWFASSLATSAVRICRYEPFMATQNEEITVWFDASAGNAALAGHDGDVYAHCGVLTDESRGTGDWKHASAWNENSDKYRMTRSTANPDIYSLSLTPSTFFGLADGEVVRSLAFVFRSADGNRQGKTDTGGDIIVPFINQPKPAGSVALGKFKSFDFDVSTATITAEGGQLIITAYNAFTFKVLALPNNITETERRSITVCATPSGRIDASEDDASITFTTSKYKAVVNKADCKVSILASDNTKVLGEVFGMDNSVATKTCLFEGMGDVAFYGGGYNGQRIDQSDTPLIMNNTQTGNWENSTPPPHNICIPFVVSTSGYGILFDDHYRGAKLTPSAYGTTYSTDSPTPVAYYFIGSDNGSMASVLSNYTALTGRQDMPPYWALGYMTSRYGYRTRSEAEATIADIKNARLPLDAIVFDLYWQGESNSGMGCLDWYAPNWNKPSEMMANFNNQGIKTICITEPYFTSKSSNYESLKSLGYLADNDVSGMEWLESPAVGLIDSSNPAAMDWMWQFYKARTAEGVGGWWLDLGEPERHDDDSNHLGGTVNQIHNEFNDLWIERVYRGMREDFPDVRPFLMPRSGTAGMQRYSVFPWSGDIRRSWGGLKAQVPALLSMGMSGVGYLGSDVGGFTATDTNPKLYLRWVEFATFSPMMRTHSPYLPEPTNPCYAEILPSVRNFLNLRYKYLPYTYTLAYENTTEGMPLARPINFYEPRNASIAGCKDQYLWGKDILVAPMMEENATSRSIALPQGKWLDMNNFDNRYTGGNTINYEAGLDVLPHFARIGAFIPRFSQNEFTCTRDIDFTGYDVLYTPDFDSSWNSSAAYMYDDDRTSTNSIDMGHFRLTYFDGVVNDGSVEITITTSSNEYAEAPDTRSFMFTMPGYTSQVHHVTQTEVNNDTETNLPSATSLEALSTATSGGYFLDNAKHILYVKTNVSVQTHKLFISKNSGGVAGNIAEGGINLSYSSATGVFNYTLPTDTDEAKIEIVNLNGTVVDTIALSAIEPGTHQVAYTAPARGAYIARLTSATATATVKVIIR